MRASILIVLCLCGLASAAAPDEQPLEVVPSVDLERYSGTWYEIARLPNRFQEDCLGDVVVEYSVRDDGKLDALNRCRKAGGEIEEARGAARVAAEGGSTGKLEVRFAPRWLSFLPFVWGDYWVLELSSDYQYALVGEPTRRNLWILSRSKELDESVLDKLLATARDRGYDVDEVQRTSHR